METLVNFDRSLFLFLNGMHSGFMDQVMWWAAERLSGYHFISYLQFIL